jgi:hypothetical protein
MEHGVSSIRLAGPEVLYLQVCLWPDADLCAFFDRPAHAGGQISGPTRLSFSVCWLCCQPGANFVSGRSSKGVCSHLRPRCYLFDLLWFLADHLQVGANDLAVAPRDGPSASCLVIGAFWLLGWGKGI